MAFALLFFSSSQFSQLVSVTAPICKSSGCFKVTGASKLRAVVIILKIITEGIN